MLATVAAALVASACTDGDDDFDEGRDTATVWRISNTPLSEDAQEEFDLLFEIFDFPYRDPFRHGTGTRQIRRTDWIRLGFVGPEPASAGMGISFVHGSWGYTGEGVIDNQYCYDPACTPLPFDEHEALLRTEQLFRDLGLDPDDFATRSSVRTDEQERPVSILHISHLLVGGVPTDLKWVTSYRNRDGQRATASGFFVTVEEQGEVPILTPAEALTQAGREPTPSALEATTLTLETRFDRATGIRQLVPVYSTPVSDGLDVGITIAAARAKDIPPIEAPEETAGS